MVVIGELLALGVDGTLAVPLNVRLSELYWIDAAGARPPWMSNAKVAAPSQSFVKVKMVTSRQKVEYSDVR